MTLRKICTVSAVVCCCAFSNAQSALTTFSDRAMWLAASGTPDFLVDFNGFTEDTFFGGAVTLDVGPFSLGASTDSQTTTNLVDVLPYQGSLSLPGDGTPVANLNVVINGGVITDTAMMTFDVPILAWGAEFGAGNMVGLSLNNADMDTAVVPNNETSSIFFGFTSTQPLSSITFFNADPSTSFRGDAFWVDNVEGVNSGVSPAVPEPTTLALIGLGLAGLGFARWCRLDA